MKRDPLMQFFTWEHLTREDLKAVSRKFTDFAERVNAAGAGDRHSEDERENWAIEMHVFERSLLDLPDNSEKQECLHSKLHQLGDAFCENYERGEKLRFLLEAKDCAIRAILFKEEA